MLTIDFQADLAHLALDAADDDALATAIEAKATALHGLGVSLDGISEVVAGMVATWTGQSVRVLTLVDEAAAGNGLDVLILAAGGIDAVQEGM